MRDTLQAEYSVIGALLLNNDVIDQIPDLQARHFQDQENRAYFAEIIKQIKAGQTCDVITVHDVLCESIPDCLTRLNSIQSNTPGYSNVKKYAESVISEAVRRFSVAEIANHLEGIKTAQNPFKSVSDLGVLLDKICQRATSNDPVKLNDMMMDYYTLLEDRLAGKITQISSGFVCYDGKMGGGFERGTLNILAARPGMGKTAFALALARNVAEQGTALFLSMEMPKKQICDRNMAALAKVPLGWLKRPGSAGVHEDEYWRNVTAAAARISSMNLYIDDQSSLNILDIRNKSRKVKRVAGLDLLVIDQVSFITGAQSDRLHEATGEYTRGLLALAKELDVPILALCQLNRECEKRQDKRPMLSDLANSGSIEQDAETITFLYRDEVYNPNTRDRGICEVIIGKNRDGERGKVGLEYHGPETRFEEPQRPWVESEDEPKSNRRGLANEL